MSINGRLVDASLRRPKLVLWLVLAVSVVSAIGFVRLDVDTDPENMLQADDPVRLANAELEEVFGAGPMIVVGIFGDVRTADAMAAIIEVHETLVARSDVVAESTVSLASSADDAPRTPAEVAAVVSAIEADQLLRGNVLFDGQPGAALFIGLSEKGVAGDVAEEAERLIARQAALSDYDVAVGGLPLAEDSFGRQMFVQMAIFAPLAGLLVFLMMLLFFRRLLLVVPAMLVALATVVITMGALVGSGNSLHIMSSMIPIFLMPIAILDSVHVLSDFFERRGEGPRSNVVKRVMHELSRPIGYTTLTTAVGFGALVVVPIPPVRVFGLFVAFGVGVAWILTMTFLPAFMVTVSERRIRGGSASVGSGTSWLSRVGSVAVRRRPIVLAFAALAVGASIPGLAALEVNDNPVKWFRADHEIREASDRLGSALPGTFTASIIASETIPGTLDDSITRDGLGALVDELRRHGDVGAVQAYVLGDHPLLRAGGQANIRLQLKSGDNKVMDEIVDSAERHLDANPVSGVELEWAGEAYLNLTWQQDMVSGMLIGFATTLGVILALLVLLFRSLRWAALAMAPVLATVIIVYGSLSMLGRDMDMPVAVLSTMVLGIGVDFAIHFVERFRALTEVHGDKGRALVAFYGEPATAMTRNALVIAVGFSPLLLSSLVPYVVVGALLASIVMLSWFASVVILPAAVSRDT